MCKMTNADRSRMETLATEVWQYVFHMVDNEPELDGQDAGFIAAKVDKAFREAYTELMRVD